MVGQPSRRTASILFVAALVLIGLMTLSPSSTYVETPMFCVVCGTLGGVDFTLNVFLFVPLGLAARWLTGRWTAIAAIGALATLTVETLQWRFIPGRDASLGDLIANTLGVLLGGGLAALGASVLQATAPRARTIATALGVVTSFVIALSAALLRPVDPIGAQYVQWTPDRPNMDRFRGSLVAVQLNGRLLRPGEPFPSQWTYDSVTRAMAVRALVRTPVPPSQRQAIIVRMGNEEYEGFTLAQRGDAAVFRATIGAARLKLRPILVGLEHALGDSIATDNLVILHGTSNPRVISLSRERRSGESVVALRRTIGLAWAMLLPWDLALNPRWWLANAIWLAALVFPVTFMAMHSRRKRPVGDRPSLDAWPVGLVLVTLLAAPALFGLSPPGLGELVGVVAGVAIGVLVERATLLSLSNDTSGAAASTAHS